MKNIIRKELTLSTHALQHFFLLFTLLALIPNYLTLMSAFFVCFGIFHSYQLSRESDDMLYSALLPIRKKDVVKAKYLMACLTQCAAFVLSVGTVAIRIKAIGNNPIYFFSPLVTANLYYLAMFLLICGLFNRVFIPGFFRTTVKIGRPFIYFVIASVIVIGLAEAAHHLPGLKWLNGIAGSDLLRQFPVLLCSIALYALLTLWGEKISVRRFDKLDI